MIAKSNTSTEKLFYTDSHMSLFRAAVTECTETEKGWIVKLDRTAFFPEGGGQPADTGSIGSVRVLDVRERAGEILHYTDAPLTAGAEYDCAIDFEQRWRRMQNHSGEHIVSGIAHALYGAENVGFHMGSGHMTLDFSCEIPWDGLMEIERRANEAVRADLPVRAWFPDSETLRELDYRSKLELTENVRIVEIPGVDVCACCAPHVSHTGEIGLIKILDSMRHRSGIRVSAVCGMDALDAVRVMQDNVTAVSKAFSAKREETGAAAERFLAGEQKLKERIAELSMANARMIAAAAEAREGNICIFDSVLDEVALRELVNMLSEKCTGYAAAFSGSDETGWRYIIGSRHVDLRKMAKEINSAICGKGGGTPEMIQGRAAAGRQMIQKFVENAAV